MSNKPKFKKGDRVLVGGNLHTAILECLEVNPNNPKNRYTFIDEFDKVSSEFEDAIELDPLYSGVKESNGQIESIYDSKGNAKHYKSERLNAIHIFERTYGTYGVMVHCEITALKYRLRMGKKPGQSLEQEILKAEWYENAAKFYFDRLGTTEEIGIQNHKKEPLPWEK